MIEIRCHGRGGQGAVIASKALASAAFHEGRSVQSFPAFGVERRGAPVMAFTRIDDRPIRVRSQIYQPDHLIVLDATLIETVDVTTGLKREGLILINSERPPNAFAHLGRFRVATVDASRIAVGHGLGSRQQPIVNTAILGAYAQASGSVGLDAILTAIAEAVPSGTDENQAAAREAYQSVRGPQLVGQTLETGSPS